jgi:hypothetical protein
MNPCFIVYSREGCHLCEDLIEHLEVLAGEHRFRYEIRDIDSNPQWRTEYHTRVPVIEYRGRPVCEYFLDQTTLLACLDTSRFSD